MNFFELLFFAANNLARQRLRSYLTLIGVVIGVAAIITIISLGSGLNNAITSELEKIGSNGMYVIPGSMLSSAGRPGFTFKTLSDSQIEEFKRIPEITEVLAPVFSLGTVEIKKKKQKVSVMGIKPDEAKSLIDSGFAEIGSGRSIKETDSFVAVVGSSIEDIFDEKVKLRDRILIEGKSFRVIGLTKKASQIVGDEINVNNTIFIPEKAYGEIFAESQPFYAIIKTTSKETVDVAKAKVEKILERDFGRDQKDFEVQTSEQIMEQVNQVLGIVQLFLIGIAAISLLVGCIGIMNTMIMAVMERTKEIGVMKAIGATNGVIISMVVLEAGIIGLIGGSIGVVIGYLIGFVVDLAAELSGFALKVQIDPLLIIGALSFSMLVGMMAGAYPARKAALLDPVEALRGAE